MNVEEQDALPEISGGLAVFVFTFTSHVGPGRTAIYAGASSQE